MIFIIINFILKTSSFFSQIETNKKGSIGKLIKKDIKDKKDKKDEKEEKSERDRLVNTEKKKQFYFCLPFFILEC